MAVIGRLTDQGELKLSGNVDTRLPLVTDGLVAHHPMDGTTKGIANLNLLDYSTWVIGSSGSQSGFPQNGDGNTIIEDLDPFGEPIAIWNALDNDVASDADGGWNTGQFAIDATKQYRFSCWYNRRVTGNGTTYFGCHGYGTTDGVYDHSVGAAAPLVTNPYFRATAAVGEDIWELWVAYVWPHDNTDYTDHPDTGVYYAGSITKISSTGNGDYRWHSSSTTANQRSYLYYSTIPATHQQFCYPRVDLIDGTEPSIEDLVNGEGNFINPSLESNISNTPLGVGVENATTNIQTVHATLANVTAEDYAPGWDTDLHTTALAQDSGWSNGYNGGAGTPQEVYHAQWVYDNDHNGICMLFRDEISPINGTFPTWQGINRGSGSNAGALGITDNMDVTLSWLQKTSNLGKAANVGLYHSREIEGTYGFETNIGQAFNTKVDEWERVSFTSNTGTNWNLALSFTYYVYGHYGTNGTLMVRDVQLELADHSTSFTETSRPSGGTLEYPIGHINHDVGSFVLKFTYEPYVHSNSTYIDLMDFRRSSPFATNRFIILRKNTSADGPTTMFIRNGSVHQPVTITGNLIAGENTLVWTWEVGVGYALYANGTLVLSAGSYTAADTWTGTDLYRFSEGMVVTENSIYDKKLSADEVTRLSKGTHSVTANGLITKQIKEEPALDKDAQHFSFGGDNKSNWNALKTVTESDTVYANNGVFISKGTTNLLLLPLINASDLVGGKLIKEDLGDGKVRFTTTDGTVAVFRMFCDLADLTNGETYAMQISYLNNTGTIFPDWCDIPLTEKPGSDRTANSGIILGTASRATYDATYRFFDIQAPSGIIMYDAQVEHNNFCSAFIDYDTTIAASKLHLPYYTIDCKRDFTIYGWWYPLEYATGDGYHPCLTRNVPDSNSTANRVLIMGAGTTSRRLQCWHGSDGITESYVLTPAGATEVKDDEWNFFCLKRDGADMKLFLGNTDGFVSGTTATAFRLDADEVTTQVWHVGQYTTGESNAYHRDYVFLQSAMTDAAIEEVFKRKMKATANGLIIQNKASPGKTL